MSDQAMAHLFEPFSSSMGSYGTSGLGLRICKMIVEGQIGGKISVESALNQGTTFTVTLPLSKNDDQTKWEYVDSVFPADEKGKPSVQPEAETNPVLQGKRILLIEDDQTNSSILRMVLEDAGMSVMCAATSQRAMEILADGGGFDLALLDHNLGASSEKDGMGLAPDLLANGVAKVVGYTGNYSVDMDHRWRAAGVSDIVRKPVSIKDLTAILGRTTEPPTA